MAKIYGDRGMVETTSTGTGDITLGSPVTAFRSIQGMLSVSDTFDYAIWAVDANGLPTGDWEVGLGTYSATNTLTRTQVAGSSNAGSAVSFAAGTKRVALTVAAATISSISDAALAVEDEGIAVDSATTTLNFTGDGVTATQTSPGVVEVSIAGSPSSPTWSVTATGTGASQGVTIPVSGLAATDILVFVNGLEWTAASYSVVGATVTLTTNASGDAIEIRGALSGGGSSSTSSDPFTLVGDMSKWLAAKARGSSNPARFLAAGDSNFAGQGSGTGTQNLTNASTTSMCRQFANLAGFRVDSVFGDQNITSIPVTMNTYDPRVVLGTGWAPQSSVSVVFGGRMFQASGGATGKFKFTPTGNISGFRLWYPRTTGLNTALTVWVDGVLVDTFSQVGASAQLFKDYTVTSGSHFIEIGAGATGNAVIQGIETFDGSSTPCFHQGGYLSALAANLANVTNPWNSLPQSVAMLPDFYAIYCTINDCNSSTVISDYYNQLESLVEAVSATANGILIGGFPSNNANTINGRLGQINSFILKAIAEDYDWFYYDTRQLFGHSFNRVGDLGLAYDANHPNFNGNTAVADGLYNFLSAYGL